MFYKETEFQDKPIGKITKGWEIQELSDFVEIETGKRAKGGGLSEGTVASIGGEHIDGQGNILWSDMKYIPEDFYNLLKQGRVHLGDILLVKDGATTGKVAIAEYLKYEKVAVNEHVFLIRSKTERLSNKFLFHFLFSKFGQRQIRTRFHGLIGGIIRSDLEIVLVPIPSIFEQRVVVGVLGVVDSTIGLVDRVIWKTERLKKGLMQTLLTKGIGHKEYKDTPIGKTPKTWQTVKLGEVLELCQYGLSVKLGDKGKYRILKMDDIVNGVAVPNNAKYVDLDEATFNNFRLEKRDILFNRTNSYELVGRTGIFLLDGDYTFASYLIRLRPKNEIVDSQFLTYYMVFSNNRLRQLATRAVHQANINATNLQSYTVPLPPLSEQKQIEEILVTLDKKLELERKEKMRLEKVKRGLMDLLLTGKVRVKVD